MMLNSSLTLFGIGFVGVFLKAIQQRNVAYDNYVWVMPISILMTSLEIYVITVIVVTGYDILTVLGMGIGAGLGAMCAMKFHHKFIRNTEENYVKDL